MVDDKRIITEPDLDYTRAFKIMLIDFDWEEITGLVDIIKKLPVPVSVFLYGSKDKNPSWCIQQAKNSSGVLINMLHRGSCETLKGFLLGEPNVFTFGKHDLDEIFQRKVIDSVSWLAIQYEQYCKTNEDNNANI